MAKKKVSDLIKELGIQYEELKKMTQSMGIEIKTQSSSIDQADADRIADTVSRLNGSHSASGSSGKHKIKAVPIIGKAMPRRKKKAEIEAEDKENIQDESAAPQESAAEIKDEQPVTDQKEKEESPSEEAEKSPESIEVPKPRGLKIIKKAEPAEETVKDVNKSEKTEEEKKWEEYQKYLDTVDLFDKPKTFEEWLN